jgi:hypothetical protein
VHVAVRRNVVSISIHDRTVLFLFTQRGGEVWITSNGMDTSNAFAIDDDSLSHHQTFEQVTHSRIPYFSREDVT